MADRVDVKERSGALERAVRVRLVLLGLLLTAGFGALGSRLWSIQIKSHPDYEESAERMHTRREAMRAYRGDISTKDGVLLARDELRHDVGIDPTRIEEAKLRDVVGAVCRALALPAAWRRERELLAVSRRAAGGEYLLLARDIGSDARTQAVRAAESVLDATELRWGLVVETRSRRVYPRGAFAASVVGVTDHEGHGKEGVESSLDEALRPTAGVREVQVSGREAGPRFFRHGNALVEPVSGWNVVITIDSRLQAIVERQLEWGVKLRSAEGGICIVLDCRSGDVLALASYPTYDPGQYAKYPEEERRQRRRNRVVEDGHEPGSVFKPFLMAAILEHDLVRPHELMASLVPAGVRWDGGSRAYFGKRAVVDVHARPGMTVEAALYGSSNIGMSMLGLRLGVERLADVVNRFGFGQQTGVLLPAEAPGEVRDPTKWRPFQDIVSMSFGYAIRITPLQLARAFAAAVNGGRLLRPRIVARLERDGVVHQFPRGEVVGQPISEETSARLRDMLREVVENEHGTAPYLALKGLSFGGKTGTAKVAEGGRYGADYLSSFEAFAPADDPEVVVLCQINRPKGKHYGGSVAGPVVVQVLRHMYGVEDQCLLERYSPDWGWVDP